MCHQKEKELKVDNSFLEVAQVLVYSCSVSLVPDRGALGCVGTFLLSEDILPRQQEREREEREIRSPVAGVTDGCELGELSDILVCFPLPL